MCFLTFQVLFGEQREDCQLLIWTVGGYYFFEEGEKERRYQRPKGSFYGLDTKNHSIRPDLHPKDLTVRKFSSTLEKIMGHKQTITGGVLAMILATSCCWLPALAVLLGGASGLLGLSDQLESYSGVLMALSAVLLIVGAYQWKKRSNSLKNEDMEVILESKITCPECGHEKLETMPTNACQFFYDCEGCGKVLKPKEGDCCVYCSYGSVKCPPIQQGESCC